MPEPVGRTISLPHTEIMTSPNSVVLKRGTERCDMQLPQVTTGNLRRVFQVSSNLVIKLHYVIALYQCSASLEVSCAPCISLVPWPLHLQYCDPFKYANATKNDLNLLSSLQNDLKVHHTQNLLSCCVALYMKTQ